MPLTLREQAELTAVRVLDEYARTQAVPGPVLRSIQAAAWRNGRALTREQIEKQLPDVVRKWADRLLAADDKGLDPEGVE